MFLLWEVNQAEPKGQTDTRMPPVPSVSLQNFTAWLAALKLVVHHSTQFFPPTSPVLFRHSCSRVVLGAFIPSEQQNHGL